MSAELLSSKIVIEEEPPALQSIRGLPTAVGMSVGITQKGPIGVATLVTSYAQWRRIFGSEVSGGISAAAVQGFFQNGGQRLYFTRTVHYSDIGVAASKTSAKGTLNLQTAAAAPSAGGVLAGNVGPYNLEPGDTLVITIDGGAPATATFTATRAQRAAANAAPYALSNGLTITVKIDGGVVQTIAFLTAEFVSIGAATAAEVAAVINAKLAGGYADVNAAVPRISSDTRGTGSHVEVTGGTANAALGFLTAVVDGTGNVADIDQVTVAEVETVVEAAVAGCAVTSEGGAALITSNTTGGASSVLVGASSTADDELGLDNATHSGSAGAAANTLRIDGRYDGEYANGIVILVTAATSGSSSEFNMLVLDDGVIVETFPNLSMDDAADRYAETVVNDADSGSNYIAVADLDVGGASGAASLQRPANSPGGTPVPFGPLTGGGDGLASIADTDFIGDDGAKTGIRSFDLKSDGTLLFIPDRPTPAVHNAMIVYCETTRAMSMFAIIDPPADLTAEGVNTYVESTASLLNLSEFGAIYWPHVRVVNPSIDVYGTDDTIVIPPSGHLAGLFSRIDGLRVGGVYDPPGGVINGRLFGVSGFATDEVLEEARRDMVYPKRINPITRHRGQPIAVDGVRTLRGNGNFPTVAERRGAIFIEQSIKDGLQFARLRNNDEALRDEVDRTITSFLLVQMKVGAFRSKDPAKAFFVDVSDALNPETEIFAGKLRGRVGLATQKPAEFIIVGFSQDTRALQEELAAAAAQ
jgi:hypothetical protein